MMQSSFNQAEVFRTEALELTDELEAGLLELESQPTDRELINRIFRALHTIKGSGQMAGFDVVATFTHNIETTYDDVREGRLEVNPGLISQTLAAVDIIRRMVSDEEVDDSEKEGLLTKFQALRQGKAESVQPVSDGTESGQAGSSSMAIFRIRFKAGHDLFRSGTNLAGLFEELRGMGGCTIIGHATEVPELTEFDPESCYLSWDIILTTSQDENAIRDVFMFVEDEGELEVTMLECAASAEEGQHRLLGELLVEKGDIPAQELRDVLAARPLLGEELLQRKAVAASNVQAVLAEQQHVKKFLSEQRQNAATSTVRVAAEKLDTLVNLVGELVIAQARLSQHSTTTHDAIASGIAEEIERLTTELRDNTMILRMLPISTTFCKFKRLARDLSRQLDKQVDLVMEGGETEIDKTVLEQLNDPLVHIIRNCCDHGIELPARRQELGKGKVGTIRLSAKHSGHHVVIAVSDDGAGLDVERIRAKALAKGLIQADTAHSEAQIYALIFEPGFSTATVVSDVSGRGVGMDVVKRSVEALRGVIEVESQLGKGTTITIRLPLTLAIIDGLLVEVSGEKFVIPQSSVVECFAQSREDIENEHGNQVIQVWGHMLPYICLRQRFAIEGEIPASRRVVLCEANDRNIGLAVDRVIGNYQTVIKPLGEVYKSVECISGSTILGDGSVALILDPAKLMSEGIRRANMES